MSRLVEYPSDVLLGKVTPLPEERQMHIQIKKIGKRGKWKRPYAYLQESRRVNGQVKTTTKYIGPVDGSSSRRRRRMGFLGKLLSYGVSYGMVAKREIKGEWNLAKLEENLKRHAALGPLYQKWSQEDAERRAQTLRERDPQYQAEQRHRVFEEMKREELAERAQEKTAPDGAADISQPLADVSEQPSQSESETSQP
jgi:hypothetical protein